MNPIEAQVKSSYYMRVIFIGIFSFGLGALLMLLEQRRWVKTLDNTGVTRRDGERFLWQDLQEKIPVKMRRKYGKEGPVNHIELVFSNGKALVFHLMYENAQEVMAFIERFPGKNKQ